MGFRKSFWLCRNDVRWFFQVWMYEYFGVGPQVLEDVGDMYPRFLCWLPNYCLSTPSKRSLQVWRMVIDNLIVADVSFFFLGGVLCLVFVFDCGLIFFYSRFFMIFKCLWILGWDVRSMLSVNGLTSWMVVRCGLSVTMRGIGILVTDYCLSLNMCTLLQQSRFLIVPPSIWLTF